MNKKGVLEVIEDVTGWFPDVHSGEGAFGGVWTCEDGLNTSPGSKNRFQVRGR